MKRSILGAFLCLVFAMPIIAAQDATPRAGKKQQSEQVDCSGVSDEAITSSVKQRMSKSPALKDAGIGVATTGGVVKLTGKIKSRGIKGAATRLTRRVDCVKKVDNQLVIEEGEGGKKDAQ